MEPPFATVQVRQLSNSSVERRAMEKSVDATAQDLSLQQAPLLIFRPARATSIKQFVESLYLLDRFRGPVMRPFAESERRRWRHPPWSWAGHSGCGRSAYAENARLQVGVFHSFRAWLRRPRRSSAMKQVFERTAARGVNPVATRGSAAAVPRGTRLA